MGIEDRDWFHEHRDQVAKDDFNNLTRNRGGTSEQPLIDGKIRLDRLYQGRPRKSWFTVSNFFLATVFLIAFFVVAGL